MSESFFVLQTPGEPRIITVNAESVGADPQVRTLVDRVRARADAFIFLAGGASRMDDRDKAQLLGVLDALRLLAQKRVRFAVGDGGTQAGIMAAAGLARQASGNAFDLIGIAPAAEIPPKGQTAIDPHHSDLIAVANSAWDASNGWWGSETRTMYQIFARLSEGRPSVALIANGGSITLTEIDENVRAKRRIVLLAGSGRAADAVVGLLRNTKPAGEEVATLQSRAQDLQLTRQPDLFQIVQLSELSAPGLADLLAERLRSGTGAR